MGLTKRPLYKRPRAGARLDGTLGKLPAPIGMPDASVGELAAAIVAAGLARVDMQDQPRPVEIGRVLDYCSIKDEYSVLGKDHVTGKACDARVAGMDVVFLVSIARAQGGVLDPQGFVKNVGGLSPEDRPELKPRDA